jgi:RES domain-containing protein
MFLWRLARAAHQKLDGEGARLNGGRWSSEGVAVVYLSSTLSLAALEYLVHIDVEDVPTDLMALKMELASDASIDEVDPDTLPDDWFNVPDHPACVGLGDDWVAGGSSLLLRVPSAIIHHETNVLLNPNHQGAATVRINDAFEFAYDRRLLS